MPELISRIAACSASASRSSTTSSTSPVPVAQHPAVAVGVSHHTREDADRPTGGLVVGDQSRERLPLQQRGVPIVTTTVPDGVPPEARSASSATATA